MDKRKAKANQLRGLASEYGLVAPKELLHLRSAIPRWLEDQENGLTDRFRRLLHGLWRDLKALDLCSLLVHGARTVIRTAQAKTDRLSIWVIRIATTRHPNIAAVALANKTARIAWAMLTKGTDYQPQAA